MASTLTPLFVLDPLHLELTVQSLNDTVGQLARNQESILIRLGAMEDVIRNLKIMQAEKRQIPGPAITQSASHHAGAETNVRPEYSPSSSPEYSPLPSPSPPEYHPEPYSLRSPSSSPPPLPPPLPPLPRTSISLAERYGDVYSDASVHYPRYSPQSQYLCGRDPPTPYPGFIPSHYSPSGAFNPFSPPASGHQGVINPVGNQLSTAGHAPRCLPIKPKRKAEVFSSSMIEKSRLTNPHTVIMKYDHYRTVSRVPTLAQKLAKEAYFGDRVLKACTVMGFRQYPALPIKELTDLKQMLFSIFPQFWNNPVEFEPVWSACTDSIGQNCKRLRGNA